MVMIKERKVMEDHYSEKIIQFQILVQKMTIHNILIVLLKYL